MTFGNGLPLGTLVADARGMSEGAFADRYGPAFLLLDDPKPRNVTGAGLETRTALAVGGKNTPALVFPVVRRPESTFDFIAVGRNENNDIVIPDASVSRFHAFFHKTASGFVLLDAGSAHGTRVDGVAVPTQRDGGAPVAVSSGMSVSFGDVRMTFLDAPLLLQILVTVVR